MNTNTWQNRERELGREEFVEEGSGKYETSSVYDCTVEDVELHL
jgi:hypothetical protein